MKINKPKRGRLYGWFTAACQLFLLPGVMAASELSVAGVRCEYLKNPSGIDELQPRLTWLVASNHRGARQTAYRVLVASCAEKLEADIGDLWDSGKVSGDQTVNVVYGGKPLESREQCFWKVCVWDEDGDGRWSQPAFWSMGLLQSGDWQADYISFRDTSPIWQDTQKLLLPPAHQYRKEFSAGKLIRRATIYATALGIYELYLNGHRVGDIRFAPGWTDYRKRAYYTTYDVTSLVTRGNNAMGAWVADGWYSGYLGFGLLAGLGTEHTGRCTYGKTPAFMAQLEIEYMDNSRQIIPTDQSWQETGDGPISEADFLMGEYYDARKETPGWTRPGFDAASWSPAIRASENNAVPATFYEYQNPATVGGSPQIEGHPLDLGFQRPSELRSFPGVPVRPVQELEPISLTSPSNGVYVFNLGQNIAGVARLKVKGAAGTTIRLRYGEQLHADGSLMTENLRRARATDYYVLRGDPRGEIYEPRFTYHGFQYVEVTGYPGKPPRDAITGVALQSDTPLTSDFECSDPMVNQLFKNIIWTQRANFLDLPTDCPQRDERFGWMGDAQIYAHCATLNADVAAFYTKWLREVMGAQRPSGTFPGYCPSPFQAGWDFGTAWCDAGVICPYAIWQAYDDKRILQQCWPNLEKFMEWRKASSTNFLGIVHGNDWGDWLSFGPKTPLDYVDTVYFAYTASLMAKMAGAIGKNQEAEAYRGLFEHIKAAFGQKYLRADGSLTVDNETAYALALYMDLLPAELRFKAGKILAGKLRGGDLDDNSGMTTGFLGTRPLLPVLTSVGENDLAVKLLQSQKFPSWGYEVAQGATTVWEHWDSYTKAHGFGGMDGRQNASMNSFAHYSFGAVCEWMLGDLAGIQSDGPGYDKIIIHPHPPTPGSNPEHVPIHWVKSHYDSIYGRISSSWKLAGNTFELQTTIPPNTAATVYLPASQVEAITESGRWLTNVQGVKLLGLEDGFARLAVESGEYDFVSPLRPASVAASPGWTVGLQELDLGRMSQDWGVPQADKSVSGGPLSIGGRTFAHGVGTHAVSEFALDLHGTARLFSAWVGVDDAAQPPGSVTFQVLGDGKLLWESGVMHAGEPAREVAVDLLGIQRLTLRVGDAGDGNGMDHADWAGARIQGQGSQPNPSPYELDLSKLRPLDLTLKTNWGGVNPAGDHLAVNAEYLERNGKPWIMVSGELHPARYPSEYWEEQILKMKAGGLNTISAYIFPSMHEEDEGVFTWTGQRDIRRFVELCAKHGMYVVLRVGPFCNGECLNGGLPQYLHDQGVKVRTNDPRYFDYVSKWYQQVGRQMNGLMFKDGGPIVAVQLENEFEIAPFAWGFAGAGGEEHMRVLKRLAIEAGLNAPIFVCTAWGSPVPAAEFLPGQGGYAWIAPGEPTPYYLFNDMHNARQARYDATQYPVANIETGPGFFCYGQYRPTIPPESSEAIALMMTARGGNILGYYMYQGGTHFVGKHGSTGTFPSLSYDFQGPLREFGQANAIYDYLKPVNYFLSDFGDLVAPMVVALPANPVADSKNTTGLRYGARARGDSGFLFLNNYQDRVQLPDRHNLQFELKLAGATLRIPEQGGFDLKQNQCAILPFNLDLEGAHLDYALAQLFTRTLTADGRTVYVFFVPEGMKGQYVFDTKTLAAVKAKSATVSPAGDRTTVWVQPGTHCLLEVKSKSGKEFEILTLTRRQALRLTRQDIFGRQRLVLSDNDVVASGGRLRVSQIGGTNLGFAVFPAPTGKLVAERGDLALADGEADGIFRRYIIQVPGVKPDIKIEGIGSAAVKIRSSASALDGVNDVFLRVGYLGNAATLKQDGALLCDNLFNRTPWEIGLKRFREKLSGAPLVLEVTPPAPIIEIINNLQVNSGVTNLTPPKAALLVGNYEVTSRPPVGVAIQGYVASVTVLPEYAVWVHAAGQ
jgi:alpha-L-rhamnosidase